MDENCSLGSVARRLPYMMMELSHCTKTTWIAYSQITNDEIRINIDSISDANMIHLDEPHFGSITGKNSSPNLAATLKRIMDRPEKIFKGIDPQYTKVELLTNFGKGIFTLHWFKNQCNSRYLFAIHYRPLKCKFLEWLWCWRESRRLKKLEAGTTTVLYVIGLDNDTQMV